MFVEQKLCEVKIFQLQSMSNAITCIDKRFVVKNTVISCLASRFDLLAAYCPDYSCLYSSNPRMKILHAKNRFKVARYDES